MRILISCGDFYPNLGGVTSLYDDLARMLQARGHEVTILTRQWQGLEPFESRNGYDIVRLDYPLLFERWVASRGFFLRSPGILAAMRRLLAERRIEAVAIGLLDMSALYLLLLKPWAGFRLVLYLHGSDTRMLPRSQRTYRWLLQAALRAAGRIIPVSDDLAREAAVFVPSAAPRMEVIPNGIDVKAVRTAPPFTHPRRYAAFVGRLVYEKDLDTLLDAFAAAAPNIPDTDLLIGGTGREEARLRKKAAAGPAAGRIHFLGRLSREQCWALLKGSLFAILPSRTEGHPIVAIEARSAGKPLLASRIPSIERLVEDGETGVLFPQGDVQALAALIEKYALDGAALEDLSARVRRAGSAGFDLESSLDRHLAALGAR